MNEQLGLAEEKATKLQTSEQVVAALSRLYPADRYAVVEQVANSTGFGVKGWADVIAVGLWPSRGIDVTGLEVKVSRQDWLSELKNGAKAENVARFCDYWFLAVGDAEIVRDGELPRTWGLIAPNKKGELYHAKPAIKNDDPQFNRGFLAAVLRRVAAPNAKTLQEEYLRGKSDARKAQPRLSDDEAVLRQQVRDYERLRKVCEDFEKVSGLSLIHEWNGKELGEAVKVVRYKKLDTEKRNLESIARSAKDLWERAENAAKALEL